MDVQEMLDMIAEQEHILVYDDFSNADALRLGVEIAEQVKESERPVAIRIYPEDIR